jgi:Ser/Thr protein kinase RdoA (MazF antagonist)
MNSTRIAASTEDVVAWIASSALGAPVVGHDVINVGYEDCNVTMRTPSGQYVAKLFATGRHVSEAVRCAEIVRRAITAGVSHPRLLPDPTGQLLHRHPETGTLCLLMEFVHGSTFFELKAAPTDDELHAVTAQAALIHTIDHLPPPVFDPWSVANLAQMAAKVSVFLDAGERRLVQEAIKRVHSVEARKLQHALIHADLTKGNVIRTPNGIAIIDFAVASYSPRIQELGVIAANLMYGHALSPADRADFLADAYATHTPLTLYERTSLHAYVLGAIAMEFLGAVHERHTGDSQSEETEYLITLGRSGLLGYLQG